MSDVHFPVYTEGKANVVFCPSEVSLCPSSYYQLLVRGAFEQPLGHLEERQAGAGHRGAASPGPARQLPEPLLSGETLPARAAAPCRRSAGGLRGTPERVPPCAGRCGRICPTGRAPRRKSLPWPAPARRALFCSLFLTCKEHFVSRLFTFKLFSPIYILAFL